MLPLEKKICRICFFSILLSVISVLTPQSLSIAMLILAVHLYFSFFINVIKVIYNRKKIIEESKCPIFVLIISVYLTNIINLSLVVWIIQRFQNSCFKEMNSYFDALYYTIITFSTVGYGDIVPQTVYAKIVSIIIIASNFLLLLAFVNLFVMKAKKKEDYLNVVMYQISFLFEEMSSCCGTIDKSNKEKSLCWSEWVDTYIKLLNSIGWEVYEEESADYASSLIKRICLKQGRLTTEPLVLHSDNGSPMKGATMLATLCQIGITPSNSRPRVSNDNPYAESLFKTLKYHPNYQSKGFETLEEAREWISLFVK